MLPVPMIARHLALALLLLLAFAPSAAAQQMPSTDAPPLQPGPGSGAPDAAEDDPPRDRPERVQRKKRSEARPARLPRTGGETLPLLITGMMSLGCGLLLWSSVPARSRP